MFVVTAANASAGAKQRGVTILGNLVLGVYLNDFATRMLKDEHGLGDRSAFAILCDGESRQNGNAYLPESECSLRCLRQCGADKKAAEINTIWAKIVAQTMKK